MDCEEIVCPAGCETELPEVDFDLCNPDVHFGQISDVFITNVGYPFDNVNDPSEWQSRLDPAYTPAAGRIVRLMGIGSKPAAEGTPVEISQGRTVMPPKQHTVPFRMDETSDLNYEFMRKLECNKVVLAWYKTFEGKLYGGNNGVNKKGVSIRFDHVIPESANELETISGQLTWKALHHPCRTDYPLQGTETGES